MANQPIPSSAGPQPSGMVPTYGAGGIFTGYAAPPPTSTVPPTQKAPVTPPPTPAPVTPATPTPTPTPSAPTTKTTTPQGTMPDASQQGVGNPTGNGNYGATKDAPYGYSTVNGQIIANQAPTNTGQVPYGSANSNNPPPATSSSSSTNTSGLSTDTATYIATVNGFSDKVNGILNGTIPLSAGEQAQIQGLEQQFQQLITQQTYVNTNNTGTAQIRGYETGTAEFDRGFQANTISQIVSAGATKIANLQTQEASAVAELTESLQNNDIKAIQAAYDLYTSAHADVAKSISDTIAATQQSMKDAAIANVISSGTTDPTDILKSLQANGNTTITADDISKAIANLSPDAAAIYSVQQSAASNGADAATLALIGKAKSKAEALQIAAKGNVANSTVIDLATKYPDAGIVPGDSIGQAQAKILNSNTYTAAQKSAALDAAYKQAQINAENATAAKTRAEAASAATTDPTTGRAIGTTGSPAIDATADGYATKILPGTGGLTQAAIDQDALATALGQPLPVPLGLSSTGAGGQKRTAINNRMAEINTGGNVAANKATLSANSKALATQVGYLNTVQRAFNTANDTLSSLTSWMSDNGINPSQFPDYNTFVNYLNSKGIDPGAAGGYNAQISTLRQEYSQVLAKGGVRSVSTDQEAAQLIPSGLSPADLQKVADRIKVDSDNVINDAQRQVQSIQSDINSIVQGTGSPSLNLFENGGTMNTESTSNGVDLNKFAH